MTTPNELPEAVFNRLSQLAGFFEAVASGCTAEDYRPIVSADEMREWAETLRSTAQQVKALRAAGDGREDSRLLDALAAFVESEDGLILHTGNCRGNYGGLAFGVGTGRTLRDALRQCFPGAAIGADDDAR